MKNILSYIKICGSGIVIWFIFLEIILKILIDIVSTLPENIMIYFDIPFALKIISMFIAYMLFMTLNTKTKKALKSNNPKYKYCFYGPLFFIAIMYIIFV